MANRAERITHQKPTEVMTHDAPIKCNLTECDEDAVNTIKQRRREEEVLSHRCQEHTSKFDIVVAGPGPLED